MECKFFNKGLK